jgi:hypothetical protein
MFSTQEPLITIGLLLPDHYRKNEAQGPVPETQRGGRRNSHVQRGLKYANPDAALLVIPGYPKLRSR